MDSLGTLKERGPVAEAGVMRDSESLRSLLCRLPVEPVALNVRDSEVETKEAELREEAVLESLISLLCRLLTV